MVFETYYFDKTVLAPIKDPEALRRASKIQDELISREESEILKMTGGRKKGSENSSNSTLDKSADSGRKTK